MADTKPRKMGAVETLEQFERDCARPLGHGGSETGEPTLRGVAHLLAEYVDADNAERDTLIGELRTELNDLTREVSILRRLGGQLRSHVRLLAEPYGPKTTNCHECNSVGPFRAVGTRYVCECKAEWLEPTLVTQPDAPDAPEQPRNTITREQVADDTPGRWMMAGDALKQKVLYWYRRTTSTTEPADSDVIRFVLKVPPDETLIGTDGLDAAVARYTEAYCKNRRDAEQPEGRVCDECYHAHAPHGCTDAYEVDANDCDHYAERTDPAPDYEPAGPLKTLEELREEEDGPPEPEVAELAASLVYATEHLREDPDYERLQRHVTNISKARERLLRPERPRGRWTLDQEDRLTEAAAIFEAAGLCGNAVTIREISAMFATIDVPKLNFPQNADAYLKQYRKVAEIVRGPFNAEVLSEVVDFLGNRDAMGYLEGYERPLTQADLMLGSALAHCNPAWRIGLSGYTEKADWFDSPWWLHVLQYADVARQQDAATTDAGEEANPREREKPRLTGPTHHALTGDEVDQGDAGEPVDAPA